jgi:transposase
MTRHYELTAEQFATIEGLLPANGKPGGRWNDHLTTLNGILWVLHTGAQWRELPERYGKWKSAHDRLTRWRADGTIDRILERLHMKLDEAGLIDHDLWCVDATSIRAGRAAAGAENGREKGGRRAGRPRPRALPRRLRHQAAPGRRRQRPAPLGYRGGRPGPRVQAVGAGVGGGPAPAARPGPPPPAPEAAGRG